MVFLGGLAKEIASTAGLKAVTEFNPRSFWDNVNGLTLRDAPHCRAHVVSALNASLPPDRSPWTTQNLFLFISAFIRADHPSGFSEVHTYWMLPKDEVIQMLYRGTTSDGAQLAELKQLLLEECDQVMKELPNTQLSFFNDPSYLCDNNADDSDDELEKPKRGFIASTLQLPSDMSATFSTKIENKRYEIRKRKHLDRLKTVLIEGGLGSSECRHVLFNYGFDQSDIDKLME